MTDALPRHYVMGIILFTFIVVGGVSMLSTMNTYNSGFTDDSRFESFNLTFNKMSDVQTEVGDLQSGIEETSADPGAFGFLNALIGSGWNTMQLMFSSFSFMNGVFNGLETVFGLPPFIPTLIGLMITVLIAFAIYSAIFQTKI